MTKMRLATTTAGTFLALGATWMVEAGANPKDVQGQMRHARISTTMDVYAQNVPDSQRRVIERTMAMVETRQAQLQQVHSTRVN